MVNRINEMRVKKGFTQSQLAEKSGLTVEMIQKFEDESFNIEKMSSYKAANIAEALGCMISDLIYEDKK